MEIILVDDGSTDIYTVHIENWLSRHYSNVKLHTFTNGGSGSASRPRNKGVELSSCKYITFLDPDNEAVSDGYSTLYNVAIKNNSDLVLGNIYKIEDNIRLFNYYRIITKVYKRYNFIHTDNDINKKTKFLGVSIQAMLINRNLIIDNNLTQVEGAIGQDTLFSWQILYYSKRISVVNIPIHIYYAKTSNSVTNTINCEFFEKLLLLQQDKLNWLINSGNIEMYMRTKHEDYVMYIFKKLSLVNANDGEECARIIKNILDYYSKYYNNSSKFINNFIDFCIQNNYNAAYLFILSSNLNAKGNHNLIKNYSPVVNNKIQTEYIQECNSFIISHKNYRNKKYAWHILDDTGFTIYYKEPYSENSIFKFDLSTLEFGKYRIRAFISLEKGVKSEDILFISYLNNKAIVDESLSSCKEKINIDCQTKGSIITLKIINAKYNNKFAWYVLDKNKFKPFHKTNYNYNPTFTYDFSNLPDGYYRIRVFILSNKDKRSEDILFLNNLNNIVSLI